MTFCIITHVIHTEKENQLFAYSPYVNEMNSWLKYVDEVIVVAPKEDFEPNPIHSIYKHSSLKFIEIDKFNLLSFFSFLKALFLIPKNCWLIFKAIQKADHTHIRCPGNMGLLACFVQIFFPRKKKTVKYAGNWDSKSKQPISYRIQKWILRNEFLTKNMQVLVYGEWENQTKNIKSFFTATYNDGEKTNVFPRELKNKIQFIFVGALTNGKRPFYALQIIEELIKKGINVSLFFYGEGIEKNNLQKYITENNLEKSISLKGNFDKDALKKVYQGSHFLILPSKSEGWPKVIAEAMFWGCLPIATPVSCVPNMLDLGNRGVLLNEDLAKDVSLLGQLIHEQEVYNLKVNSALKWSRNYTIDKFESEIIKLIQS